MLDDVLVVNDLLAHVDGRAVEVQRLLHRDHGSIHARAVAARSRQQDLAARRGHLPIVGGAVGVGLRA